MTLQDYEAWLKRFMGAKPCRLDKAVSLPSGTTKQQFIDRMEALGTPIDESHVFTPSEADFMEYQEAHGQPWRG